MGSKRGYGIQLKLKKKTMGNTGLETTKVLPPQLTINKTDRDVKKPLQDNLQT